MGCDGARLRTAKMPTSFNPRTHMGCDFRIFTNNWFCIKFQSTHPHGVRQEFPEARRAGEGFNPRTHMGCDSQRLHHRKQRFCFNPRTHMGCDKFIDNSELHPIMFQSTHPHGVRHRKRKQDEEIQEFQSTHPHGVRHSWTLA